MCPLDPARFLFFAVDERFAGADNLAFFPQRPLSVFACKQILIALADQVYRIIKAGPSGHRPIYRDEAAVEVFKINVIRQVLHQGGEQLALFRQSQFGAASFGDVPGDTDDP
jgi:hypothetical protein